MKINEDNFNRLAISLMELNQYSYIEALNELNDLKLSLVCGEKIKTSFSLQAALITAVNCGTRAFLGGVYVNLPENTPRLIPWDIGSTLNEVVTQLGGQIEPSETNFTLYFGKPIEKKDSSLEIVCNAWQGGVLNHWDSNIILSENESLPLGGIAAGAIGVGSAFLKITGIDQTSTDFSAGISLWRPDQKWCEPENNGPIVKNFPLKFWILGLGHLGQSYLWNIGLLPYQKSEEVNLVLQDYDRITSANLSSGLLSGKESVGCSKARVCADWLEKRNFKTIISERKFNEHTKVSEGEPLLALCGFDSGHSRQPLQNAGFEFIIDCALGGNLDLFDNIILRTFPDNSRKVEEIWKSSEEDFIMNPHVAKHIEIVVKEDCGILARTLGNKAISSSFVGALSGAMAVSEVIRGLNGGQRYDTIVAPIRNINLVKSKIHKNKIIFELARNGFTSNLRS